MSDFVGIDFTAIENFREKVTVKLDKKTTLDLPLILGRDAFKAENLRQKWIMCQTEYQLVLSKLQTFVDDTETISEADVANYEKGVDILEAKLKSESKYLDELSEIGDKIQAVTDAILDFIAPYLKDYKFDNRPFNDCLREKDTSTVYQIFVCMYMGTDALKENSEVDESTSEKN